VDRISLAARQPVVVAAIAGAPLTTVEAVFRMNGSDGVDGWWLADVRTRGRWIEYSDHGLCASSPVETVWIVERR
jgi:hypothetical protein